MSKDAVLKLSLKSNSGYSCQQTANIDVSQWGAIQGVISGNHVFLAARDLRTALERILVRAEAFSEAEQDMQPHSAEAIADIARNALAKARGEA
ncbi:MULTISPECIES: hypothetical protein [Pseudomonas]|uniref:Uncharacterized protein n=1 Tax=Pseudomonas lutea TaxID=243924 RepID=A0A9X8MHV6_9PSED|nr:MULTISPECIES: hypothetical protein [Pseudomonas]SER51067.1 hypothetical protein SAMN05216409_1322 [Pseudomonas lutea]